MAGTRDSASGHAMRQSSSHGLSLAGRSRFSQRWCVGFHEDVFSKRWIVSLRAKDREGMIPLTTSIHFSLVIPPPPHPPVICSSILLQVLQVLSRFIRFRCSCCCRHRLCPLLSGLAAGISIYERSGHQDARASLVPRRLRQTSRGGLR